MRMREIACYMPSHLACDSDKIPMALVIIVNTKKAANAS